MLKLCITFIDEFLMKKSRFFRVISTSLSLQLESNPQTFITTTTIIISNVLPQKKDFFSASLREAEE